MRLRIPVGALVVMFVLSACSGWQQQQPTPSSGPSEATAGLLAAAYANDVARARDLIAQGADVNHKDATVQSAYLISTSEVGDDPALLDLCLANGADINAKDSYNGTGLIRAADRGFPTIVDRLLKAGIDKDHINNLGWTALLEAVILGGGDEDHQLVIKLLLDAGVDRSIRDADGKTAMDHAREQSQTEVIRLLES